VLITVTGQVQSTDNADVQSGKRVKLDHSENATNMVISSITATDLVMAGSDSGKVAKAKYL
jgi:D-arabinose 5-phosphate isomerase GutQ